jgi:hypothetical protein
MIRDQLSIAVFVFFFSIKEFLIFNKKTKHLFIMINFIHKKKEKEFF